VQPTSKRNAKKKRKGIYKSKRNTHLHVRREGEGEEGEIDLRLYTGDHRVTGSRHLLLHLRNRYMRFLALNYTPSCRLGLTGLGIEDHRVIEFINLLCRGIQWNSPLESECHVVV
jgi:hypothetical protein